MLPASSLFTSAASAVTYGRKTDCVDRVVDYLRSVAGAIEVGLEIPEAALVRIVAPNAEDMDQLRAALERLADLVEKHDPSTVESLLNLHAAARHQEGGFE